MPHVLARQLIPVVLSIFATSVAVAAADKPTSSSQAPDAKLRICASADELPFSSKDGSGFENKIASAIAGAMGRAPEFVWSDKPSIYAVRDQLDKRLCDVIIGIDTSDQRVLTTQPYYRTGYVFIQKAASPLKLEGWDSPDIPKVSKIGFVAGTPAEVMVRKVGLYEDSFNYAQSLLNYKSRRNQYLRVPPDRMVAEVADGKADVAVHFAPEVARYVKQNSKLKLTLIPDHNVRDDGEKVPHHFDQSMGVRLDDSELLAQLHLAIEKAKPVIDKILAEEGIPLAAPSSKTSNKGASIQKFEGPEFE